MGAISSYDRHAGTLPNALMEIIPVIDIKGGGVVHAKRGERTNYEPISTRLSASPEPMDVVQGFLNFLPFENIYIADLDAITGDSRNDDIIIAIAAAYPELRIWLDAGFSTRDTMARFMRTTNIDFVFASESIPSMSGFERMRAPLAPERVVLSLDRSGAALIGCPDIFEQPNAWPERIIHMNLSRVGAESGPDWDGLKDLHETAGGHKIYAAGGVRDEDDLRRLAEFGISGALVATALHNGGIRSLRLDGWSN